MDFAIFGKFIDNAPPFYSDDAGVAGW